MVLSVDSLIFISTTPHALKGDRSFYEPPSHKSARTPLSRLPVKDVWAGTSLHAMGKGSSMPLADGTSSFLLLQANPENFASLGKATGVRLGENRRYVVVFTSLACSTALVTYFN